MADLRGRIVALRAKAARARDVSLRVSDKLAETNLLSLAVDLEREALELEKQLEASQQSPDFAKPPSDTKPAPAEKPDAAGPSKG